MLCQKNPTPVNLPVSEDFQSRPKRPRRAEKTVALEVVQGRTFYSRKRKFKGRDLTDSTVGRLTVIRVLGMELKSMWWLCSCICGTEVIAKGADLERGFKKSCGCLQRDTGVSLGSNSGSHYMSGTGTYKSWQWMMSRCFNEKVKEYPRYGGRGILPCASIKESPHNLLAAIGPRPEGQTLDRIDGNLGYFCGTCEECVSLGRIRNIRWATRELQNQNQERVHKLNILGCVSIREVSEKFGIKYSTIFNWIRMKWPTEKIETHIRKLATK